METIQVVLDAELLRATDAAARQAKVNRSALIREALSAHLRTLEIRTRAEQDRRGYEAGSKDSADLTAWEAEAAWPED